MLTTELGVTFDALEEMDGLPPDPTLAVGPANMVAMVNSQIALYDKAGTELDFAHLDLPFGGRKLE